MKAMIFAAGRGTRLRPLTDHLPKALVPVAGKTMLQRVIERLKEAGVDELVINIHHLGEQVIDFLQQNKDFDLNIHLSDERGKLLDTGGGILHACPWLDGNAPFIVHNVDILSDTDLKDLYRHHYESGADATLLVSKRTTSRYLLLDDACQLHGWLDKSTGEVKPAGLDLHNQPLHEWAFGGIHVISPSLFRVMERNGCQGTFSIIPFYLAACSKTRIQGYPLKATHWFDIGKPETLEAARQFYQGGDKRNGFKND